MSKPLQSDIIISGGGLIGQAFAVALAHHGLSSRVIDPMDPAAQVAPAADGRVASIASGSWKMLETIGITPGIAEACPIEQIWVSDGLKPGELDFQPQDGTGPLGYMVQNRHMRLAVQDVVAAHRDLIHLHMPAKAVDIVRDAHRATVTLDTGEILTAPLMVVAEGRFSPTREAEQFGLASWDYHYVALVGQITHETPHDNIAYEIFYPDGPFAILPMENLNGKHRSAYVFTVPKAKADAYKKLGDRGFLAELDRHMGGMLGAIELAAPRMSYPLGFIHTAKVIRGRLVLIGDTAHGMHPIAGQGLNLGYRDVAALTQVLVEGARLGLDLGDNQLLEKYERWRSMDSVVTMGTTDALVRLFSVPGKTMSAVRRFGLGAVQRSGPLKTFFMGEARGEGGELPKLLAGMEV